MSEKMSTFSRCVICTTPTDPLTETEDGGESGKASSPIIFILKEVLQLPSSSLENLPASSSNKWAEWGLPCCPICAGMGRDLEVITGRVKEVVKEYYKARAVLIKRILEEREDIQTNGPTNNYEKIRKEIIQRAALPLRNLNIEDEDLKSGPVQIQNGGKRRGRPKRFREIEGGEDQDGTFLLKDSADNNNMEDDSNENDPCKSESITETVVQESSKQRRVRRRKKVIRRWENQLTSSGNTVKTEPLDGNQTTSICDDDFDDDFSLLQQFSSNLSEEDESFDLGDCHGVVTEENTHSEEETKGDKEVDPDYNNENDLSEDSDADYKPNVAATSKKSPREKRKTEKLVKITIIPSTTAKSSLPNPFVSMGPNLSSEGLGKLGVKVKENLPGKKRGLRGPYTKSLGGTKGKIFSGDGFRFKCDHEGCKYGTNFRRKFDEHFRKHTGETPFKCPKCGKGFRASWAVVSHLRSHDKPKQTFKCQICPREFTRYLGLQGHITKEHKDTRRQCDICNGIFTSAITLRYHKKRVHENKMDCICELCGKVIVGAKNLQDHIKRHETDHNFKPRGPKTPLQLPDDLFLPPIAVIPAPIATAITTDPEQIYTSKPGFICDKDGCGKWFATAKPLQFHIRRYHMTEEERKVSCPICYKVFKDLLDLKKHASQVHMEVRPFACSICGQAFKIKQHCRRHEEGHSKPGWKPKANCKPKTFPGVSSYPVNEGTISRGMETINFQGNEGNIWGPQCHKKLE